MGYTHDTHVELATNVPGWTELQDPGSASPAPSPGSRQRSATTCTWPHRLRSPGARCSGVSDGDLPEPRLRHLRRHRLRRASFLTGADGAAGEVGYTLFRGRPEERMAADGIGPFEAWFGGAGAARRLAEAGLPASVAETLELSATNPAAREFIDELWTGIAVMIVNMCTCSEPERGLARRRLRARRLGRSLERDQGADTAGSSHTRPRSSARASALTPRCAAPSPSRSPHCSAGEDGSARVILTVTANVAIDRTYVIDELTSARSTRCSKVFAHTGGKGVNVSRSSPPSAARRSSPGLIGDAALDEATRELAAAGLDAALFPVARATRQTVTVTAKDGTTTAFDEAGPQITQHGMGGLRAALHKLLHDADMVVIAGSLPPGTPEESLANLCKTGEPPPGTGHPRRPRRGHAGRAKPSPSGRQAQPRRARADARPRAHQRRSDRSKRARELRAEGAQNVVVTLGADGAIGLNEHGAWRVTHPAAPGNPIGAGDAFSAALAMALTNDQPFEQALQEGAAAALASLKAPTAGALNPADMRSALPNIADPTDHNRGRATMTTLILACRPSQLAARLAGVAGRRRRRDRSRPPAA